MKAGYSIAAMLCALITAGAQAQTTLCVDDDAPLGGDGQSWATAFKYLQDALTAAQPGSGVEEIRVGQGTYKPDQDEGGNVTPGDREASFQLIDNVALMGGYAGVGAPDPDERDVDLYETILSGDLGYPNWQEDNSYHVLIGSGADPSAVLEGFVVECGYAYGPTSAHRNGAGILNDAGSPTLSDCTFRNNWSENDGGAMLNINGSQPTVTNSTFSENRGVFGGAVKITEGGGLFDGCSFSNDMADGGGAIHVYYGNATLTGCLVSECASRAVTIIHGDVTISGCEFSSNTSLNGPGVLRIADQSIVAVTDCQFVGNSAGPANDGGAVDCSNESSLTMSNCTFTNNSAYFGGAVHFEHGTILIEDCAFENNTSTVCGGGGLAIWHGSATVTDSTFVGNVVEGGTGGGGGLAISDSTGIITDCVFEGNSTSFRGGGLWIGNVPSPIFANLLVIENTSGEGGGISMSNGGPTIANSVIAGNSANEGGGIWIDQSDPLVVNSVVYANTATAGGGLFCGCSSSSTIVANSLFWGNEDDGGAGESAQIRIVEGDLAINYSCIQGITGALGGIGNMGNDPLFIDPLGPDGIAGTLDDNLCLLPGSPCIDAGDNWGLPADALDIDGDGNTCELLPFDLDGAPRFVDDPTAPDGGCGVPVIVDMGSYEMQYLGGEAEVIHADVNGDGTVDVLDLLAVLASWGPSAGCGLADLDISGTVDVLDLLEVLAAWGPC